MIKRILVISLYLILVLYNNVFARSVLIHTQWKIVVNQNVYDVIQNENGMIISTSALSWPDGRSGLIIYLKTEKNIYRCIDWKNSSFQDTGFYCAKLIKPEYESKPPELQLKASEPIPMVPTPSPQPTPRSNGRK